MYRCCLLISLMLLSACSNLLFAPIKSYPLIPEIPYEDIYFESEDSIRLHGWKIHAINDHTSNHIADYKGTILFFHGNGDNVSTQLPNTYWLAEAGYDVYIFDYRGYGKSKGSATLDNTINDLELMIAHVIKQLPEDERLIILGHSLGASMAIYSVANSAYRDRIKCLVTVAAFSDYRDVVQEVLSKNWLSWVFQWPLSYTIDNSYRPLDFIARVAPVPVLILHSKSDEMIDLYHGKKLFEAAKNPKTFSFIGNGHSWIFAGATSREFFLNYINKLSK